MNIETINFKLFTTIVIPALDGTRTLASVSHLFSARPNCLHGLLLEELNLPSAPTPETTIAFFDGEQEGRLADDLYPEFCRRNGLTLDSLTLTQHQIAFLIENHADLLVDEGDTWFLSTNLSTDERMRSGYGDHVAIFIGKHAINGGLSGSATASTAEEEDTCYDGGYLMRVGIAMTAAA